MATNKIAPFLIVGLLALSSCETREVQSDLITVDTRGIPIVRIVIQGPGGDLVPVTYERHDDTGVFITSKLGVSFLLGAALVLGIYWLKKRDGGE